MGHDSVQVRWVEGRQLIGWDQLGHGVVMDALPDYGGEGTGPTPIRLVLYALAGCTAMDVVSILDKKRQDIRDLQVFVEADRREDEHPKIYTDIVLRYVVTGFGVDEKAVARAIELSEGTYCSVGKMLGPQVSVRTEYEVREARPSGVSLFQARDGA